MAPGETRRRATWVFVFAFVAVTACLASEGISYQHERKKVQPNLPGIIHSAPCVELAPGVYDCGNHKNPNRQKVPKSGRWKITVRPIDDITITARSKAEREASQQQ